MRLRHKVNVFIADDADLDFPLFGDDDAAAPGAVDKAVDDIRDRFGNASVGRARTLDRR